jgi:hypothetical protein
VVANFGPTEHAVSLPGRWTADVATSDLHACGTWNGTVEAETAVILSPEGDDD